MGKMYCPQCNEYLTNGDDISCKCGWVEQSNKTLQTTEVDGIIVSLYHLTDIMFESGDNCITYDKERIFEVIDILQQIVDNHKEV